MQRIKTIRDFFRTQNDLANSFALFIAIFVFFVCLTPSVGVTDSDAFAYIEGAHSLARGLGYVDAAGETLNHWPVGYSFLLSLFPDVFRAAYWINAFCLSVATQALFLLAIQGGWRRLAAAGFALAFGCGFLASMAAPAKPDILTYAVFLVAALFIFQDRPVSRTVGLSLLSILIPVKTIAIVFAPSFIICDILRHKPSALLKRWWEYLAAAGAWLAAFSSSIAFNLATIGVMVPTSLAKPTLSDLLFEAWRFVRDFFRAFIANWYGSIRPPLFLVIFAIVLISGLFALASLRRENADWRFRRAGAAILGLSWLLELVRVFFAGPRLMGYGIFLVLLGHVPKATISWRWMVYAAACFVAAVLNAALVDSVGAGHPAYAAMAHRIGPYLDRAKPLYSNSEGLVDLYLGWHAIPATELPASSTTACFLEVRLPNYDAVGEKVWPIGKAIETWRLVVDIESARLYCRP